MKPTIPFVPFLFAFGVLWTMYARKLLIVLAGIAAMAAMSGCRGEGDAAATAPPDAPHRADFSGTIPAGWPLCKPFADDNGETVQGFLVVDKVKDHPNLAGSGVEPGDICLSWGTFNPEAPETLREAWLAFLGHDAGDEEPFWFARDRDGKTEVFSCGMGELFECAAALGTFGLELRPAAFRKEDAERIRAAAAARKAANQAGRSELLTLSPPLQEGIEAFGYAFKTADGVWRGRVDMMRSNLQRLALWRRGRSLSALPDCVAEVAWQSGGNGGDGRLEPVGNRTGRDFVRLWEFNNGTDQSPPLVLEMQTPSGGTTNLPALRVPWNDLRIEQAAADPDPFTPEPPDPGLAGTLHPSLVQIPFEPILCFEADDGTLAGRIDRLPTKHLGAGADGAGNGDFGDSLAIYRISVFRTPVGAGQKPDTVFCATRRMDGNNGGHTYVDVTWEYSLGVATQSIEPPGAVLTALDFQRWPMATPELGLDMLESSIPAHPVRWRELCK